MRLVDEVVLVGRAALTVPALARRADTVPHDVLAGIAARVARVLVGAPDPERLP